MSKYTNNEICRLSNNLLLTTFIKSLEILNYSIKDFDLETQQDEGECKVPPNSTI